MRLGYSVSNSYLFSSTSLSLRPSFAVLLPASLHDPRSSTLASSFGTRSFRDMESSGIFGFFFRQPNPGNLVTQTSHRTIVFIDGLRTIILCNPQHSRRPCVPTAVRRRDAATRRRQQRSSPSGMQTRRAAPDLSRLLGASPPLPLPSERLHPPRTSAACGRLLRDAGH
ncbi:hypothetical protein C8R45DRAFT_565995 [Mycena sanguinolenta]|nr:hypothetical protein C8R45DRAFT_565995 [Mycena sanguinolenta]